MSYDIRLENPDTGATLEMPSTHDIAGGTRMMGGTADCWLNVTYNYSKHYQPLFSRHASNSTSGIRWLYGKTGAESIPVLEKVIADLTPDEGGYSYWDATEGNARRALEGLLVFAKQHPHGTWRGD